jgi:hypothetical protein
MRPIPEKQKEEMASDKYYKKCCYPLKHICSGKIEWHHNLILGGRQSNLKETILPICQNIHEQARNTEIKEVLDMVMLNRMSDSQIKQISRAIDYSHRKKYLNAKHNIKG